MRNFIGYAATDFRDVALACALLIASVSTDANAQITATSAATSGATCTATRFNILNSKPATNDLGCTANEFTVITSVNQPAGGITSCTAGQSIIVSVVANLSGTNAFRNDGGLYFGESGNDPEIHGGQCSVARFPLTSTGTGFTDSDTDQCGDYFAAGVENWQVNNVHVLCRASPTTGTLDIPYLITWKQPGSNTVCSSDTDNNLIPGTTSKCQTGSATLSTSVGTPVTVRGWVKVTKVTSPNAMPDVFSFSAAGPAGSNVSPTSFTLTNGNTQEVDMDLATGARTLTITESALGGWDPTASIACTDFNNNPSPAYVTVNNATRTITANLDPTNYGANCTITNFQTRVRTLKALSPVSDPGLFDLSTTTNIGTASVNNVGNNGATAYEPITSGNATISETAGTATVLANYTTSVACVDDTVGGSVSFSPVSLTGTTRSGTVSPPAHHDVTCTITNTRKSTTLQLTKAWAANAIAGDQANIGATTGLTNNTSAFSATAPSGGSSGTVTVFSGETATLPAETTTPAGTLANYLTSLACTGGTLSGGNGQTSNTLVINPADAGTPITCTYTNTHRTRTLTVVKSLSPVGDSGTFVMNANGTTGAAAGNGATSSAAVSVGATANFSEAAGSGATNLSNYTTTWSCNTSPATTGSGTSGSLTIPDADVTCTITNTRKTHTLTVVKALSPVADPGTFIMNANGTTGAAAGNGATSSATVNVGATANFSEAAGSGATNLSNYTTTWSCNTSPATTGSGTSGSLTMPDADVTCTVTNTRKSHNVTVTKSLSPAGDPGKFDLQVNATTVKTDAGNGDSGTANNVGVGTTVSIAELAGTGTSLSNYTTSAITCTGITPPAGTTSGSFTMPDNDVSCTFTNTRKQATLQLKKAWVSCVQNDTATVSASASLGSATTGTSTCDATGNNSTNGAAVTVYAGNSGSITEAFGANATTYTASLNCTGTSGFSGTTLTVGSADTAIVCTQTNTSVASITTKKVLSTINGSAAAAGATVKAGDVLVYTITSTNSGATAGSTTLTETVPNQTTYTGSGEGWSAGCTTAGTQCSQLQSVAGNSSGNVTFTVKVVTPANPGALTNTLTSSSDASCGCSVTNTIVAPSLSLSKSSNGAWTTGQTSPQPTYTLTVTNTGGAATNGTVTVLDTLPAGTTAAWVGTLSTNGWSCTFSGQNVTCTTAAPIAASGGSSTINLPVNVTATGGTLTNFASVGGGGDPNNGGSPPAPGAGCTDAHCANNNTSVTPTADIALTKTVDNPAPNVGETVTFTITAKNNGPNDATGVQVTDSLPSGLQYQSSTVTGTTTYNNVTGVWTIGALANGATETLTITALVTQPGMITNTATVTASDQTDPDTSNNSAGADLNAVPSADIQVNKIVNNNTPNVGSNVTFTITVKNAGPDDATGVQVADLLPAGLSFVSATPSQGTYNSGTGLWNIGTIVNGASVTLTITATVTQAGSITNTATKTAENEHDPVTSNDQSGVTINGQSADIQVTKAVDNATPNVGDTVTFTITTKNNGPSDATGVQVTDLLPAGLSFVSATPSQGSYNSTTGLWDIGSLPANATVTLTITATVTQSGSIINTATKTAEDQSDPVTTNDTSSVGLGATPKADLSIVKDDGQTTAVPGSPLTYTIIVKNTGPSDVTGATVSDTLPGALTGVTWSCAASAGSTCGSGSGDISDTVNLLNGGMLTYTVTGTLDPAATGTLSNTATVTAPAGVLDPDTSNNSSNDTDTLTPQADVGIVKSGPATVTAGQNIVYTVTVTNNGPSTALNVSVADTTPAGLTFVSNAGACVSAYPCSLGTLTPGQSVTITTTYTVSAAAANGTTIANTATVSTSTTDTNGNNDSSTANTTVVTSADLSILKTGPVSVVAGQNVTYTITVTNNGPSNAQNAVVSDPTPAGLTFVSNSGGCITTYPCILGTLTVGQVVTITTTYAVPASYGTGTITNTATVSSTTSDPDNSNNSSSANTSVGPTADLSVTKADNSSTYTPGMPVTYSIVVTNTGPSDVVGANVSDPLPAGITTANWSCIATNGTCTANGSNAISDTVNIAAGGVLTYTLTLTVPSSQTGNLVNTATATNPPGTTDPNPGDNNATDTDTAAPVANLAITKTANPSGTYLPGQPLSYTIKVTNNGPSDVSGVSVSDNVPSALLSVTWTCAAGGVGADCDGAAAGTGASGSGNTIALGNVVLPSGTNVTITVNGTVDLAATGTITNTAGVTPPPGTGCSNPPCNQTSTVNNNNNGTPQLSVIKTATPAAFAVGQSGSYSITVSNTGTTSTNGVITVTDTLPAGITMTALPSGTGWTCTTSTATQVICTTNAVLLPGSNAPVINVPVTIGVSAANPSTNTATATGGGDDTCPNAAHCSGSVPTPVDAPKLDVTKTTQGNLVVGVQSTYLISVTNNGTAATIAGGSISDTIPTGLTIGTLPGGCSNPSGQLVNCVIPAGFAPGSTLSFAIPVTPQASTNGTNVSNTATVSGGGDPTCPNAPHCGSTVTNTVGAPQLQLTKTANPTTFTVGQQATYTLTLTNVGTAATTATATITDTIPAGLTIGTLPGGCSAAGQTVTCTVAAPLATNSPVAFDIPVTAQAAVNGQSVSNTAGVTGGGDPGCPTGTAVANLPARCVGTTTDPVNAPQLTIVKTASASNFIVGQSASYTLKVTNTGTAATTSAATITDAIPANLTIGSLPGGCSAAGQVVTCTINAGLAVNAFATFVIPVTPTAAASGTMLSNTATVQGGGDPGCPNAANCTSTVGPIPVDAPQLTIVKTASSASFSVGVAASFTLTVTNTGTAATTAAATISDTIPTGLTIGSLPGGCSAAGQVVTCTIAAGLAANASTNFVIPVTPTAAAQPSVTNTATVTGGGDPTCPNATHCTSTIGPIPVDTPQLTIVKTASSSSFSVGVAASFTLTVTNTGTAATTAAATISDTIPTGLTIGSLPGGCSAAGQAVTCTIAAGLAPNASTNFVIPVTPTAAAQPSVTNTATVTGGGDPTCPNAAHCTSTIGPIPVDTPQLTIAKTASSSSFSVGVPASYTLTVTNTGTAPTTASATVSDTIPSGLTIGTVPGGCTSAGQTVTCTIAAGLAVNGSISFVIPVTPTSAAVPSVTNSATVSGGGDPSCPGANNCTSVVTTPVTSASVSADLRIVKTGPTSIMAGTNIVYTISVTNLGPDAAVNTIISDPAPAGLTFVSSGAPCSAFPCSLGTLAVNQTVTIPNVTFHVPANYTSKQIVNVASAVSDVPDPTPNNNSSTVSTPVITVAKPIPTPIDARWMLLTMLMLFAGVGALVLRRRRN